MGFYEILDQVVDLLRQRGRVTYRALQREFQSTRIPSTISRTNSSMPTRRRAMMRGAASSGPVPQTPHLQSPRHRSAPRTVHRWPTRRPI
jgi:hypothetical protein